MKKYVAISSNHNPDYEFYLPLVEWAWQKFGWETITLRPIALPPYREETVTQCIRLYAALMNEVNNEDIIMTSDADMLPLSDYWQPNAADITVYGHDLTGHQQVPMCYVAMTKANWLKVMNLAPMSYSLAHYLRRDLADTNALSTVQHEWWVVDQDILTDRLSKHQVVNVLRGIEPNSYLPLGRMDRANMKQYPQTLIDFHGPRKGWEHLPKIKEILLKAFGELPEWFDKMYEVRK